jgi:hypothetical protein
MEGTVIVGDAPPPAEGAPAEGTTGDTTTTTPAG